MKTSEWIHDLHLYLGLFISPFVLIFAVSVFYMVHVCLPEASPGITRSVSSLPLPLALEKLSGRERIDALRPALEKAGVHGEVGWVQHRVKENQLIVPVTVPGRLTTVTFDLSNGGALVREQRTGLASGLVFLHKSPGPHLVTMRMNWPYMKAWLWFSDATVYLILFTTLSGLYLWCLRRSERLIGLMVGLAGALCFFGLVYAITH